MRNNWHDQLLNLKILFSTQILDGLDRFFFFK